MKSPRAPGAALIAVGLLLGGLPALRWQEHRPPPAFGDPAASGTLAAATAAVRLRPPRATRSPSGPTADASTLTGDRPPAVTRPAAAVAPRARTPPSTVPVAAADDGPRGAAISVPIAVASHDARLELVAGRRLVPVAVRLASLGIDAPVVPATVQAGELLIPDDPTTAAWYQGGPTPGEAGSAVVAAHVDFGGRLGAFYRLEEAKPGDAVDVGFDDGSTRSFRVVALGRIPRDALPSGELFAPVGDPTLTLITCGGEFDSSTRHYADNVVLRAVPAP